MKSDSGSAPVSETPTPLVWTDELPCFRVTVEIDVAAKDHDDAMEWTGDLLERWLNVDEVIAISADVPHDPLEIA